MLPLLLVGKERSDKSVEGVVASEKPEEEAEEAEEAAEAEESVEPRVKPRPELRTEDSETVRSWRSGKMVEG